MVGKTSIKVTNYLHHFNCKCCSDLPRQLRLGKPKALQTAEPLYLQNKLSYELDFLHVIRYVQIQLFDLVPSYGCCQSYVGMSNVILNTQERNQEFF